MVLACLGRCQSHCQSLPHSRLAPLAHQVTWCALGSMPGPGRVGVRLSGFRERAPSFRPAGGGRVGTRLLNVLLRFTPSARPWDSPRPGRRRPGRRDRAPTGCRHHHATHPGPWEESAENDEQYEDWAAAVLQRPRHGASAAGHPRRAPGHQQAAADHALCAGLPGWRPRARPSGWGAGPAAAAARCRADPDDSASRERAQSAIRNRLMSLTLRRTTVPGE